MLGTGISSIVILNKFYDVAVSKYKKATMVIRDSETVVRAPLASS